MHSDSIPMQYEHAKSQRETVWADAPDAIYALSGTSPRSQPTGAS